MYIVKRIRAGLVTFLATVTTLVASTALVNASPVVVGGGVTGPFPYTVSASTPVQYYTNFGGQFNSISQVCFSAFFDSSNGFDPSEQLRFEIPGGTSGKIVTNSEQVVKTSAGACFTNPVDTNFFRNGAYAVRVYATNGSVTITSASTYLFL